MNILYRIIYLIFTFTTTVIVYKFSGKEGTYIWIAVSVILSNIQSVKMVDIFGYTTVLGNIAYSNVFLATDILNEFDGKKSADKSVLYGFLSMAIFTLLMSFSLLFIPNSFDTSQESLTNIFTVVPRICIASLIAFLCSQFFDVFIYQKLKQRYNKLWLSNNGSTILSQLIDTIIFIVIGYLGTMPLSELAIMALTMYVLKVIIALCDTVFIYIVKKIKKREGNNGHNL